METRKYFLDWLRVGAFALLILFHVGMLYVTWSYNIKSPRLVPGAEPFLSAFAVWRMPLLFLISGLACRFLIAKLGPGSFALDRLRRLLPVILFGMFVVIPPQTYVMLVWRGLTHEPYLHFWWFQYLRADQTLVAPLGRTMPTWDHLWFLVYLLDYTLLFAVVAALARVLKAPAFRLATPVLLIAPAVSLVATNLWIDTVFPLTHDLTHDWGGHAKWIGLFAFGVLSARHADFWTWLRDHRRALAVAALALLAAQWVSSGLVWSAVSGLYAWAAICAICGYAYRYLDRPSGLLGRLNEAILPVYVLHQPILLIAAFWLFPLRLPLAIEALALAAVTYAGSFAIYEALIRPIPPMRFLFGLKWRAERRLSPGDGGAISAEAQGARSR